MNPSFAPSYHGTVVSTESPVHQSATGMGKDTCGDVCTFDDWYRRAHCEERDLNYVPHSYGCEGAVMLELQNNQISQITRPCTLGYDLVRTIDLSGNELTFFQYGTFMSMNNLKNIILSNNLLREVENFTFIGTEESLMRIFLNHNQIKTIHKDAFCGLSKVTYLYLNYNQIRFLYESAFRDMYALRHLYLGDNKLHHLRRNTFQNLGHLESITLSKNNLRWIPQGLFSGLTSLKEIILAGNQLVTILPPKHLGINTKLELLNFQNNNFNTTGEILPYLKISDQLLFDGNPFICDCTFMTVRDWYQNKSNTDHHIQHDQIGCFWNESFISIIDDFPVHCEGSRVGNFSMQTESPDEKQYPTFSVVPTPWTSQVEVLFTSIETVGTIIPGLPKEYVGCALINQKLEWWQRVLLIYCATVLTLFFILWVVKNLVIHFKEK